MNLFVRLGVAFGVIALIGGCEHMEPDASAQAGLVGDFSDQLDSVQSDFPDVGNYIQTLEYLTALPILNPTLGGGNRLPVRIDPPAGLDSTPLCRRGTNWDNVYGDQCTRHFACLFTSVSPEDRLTACRRAAPSRIGANPQHAEAQRGLCVGFTEQEFYEVCMSPSSAPLLQLEPVFPY